MQSMQYVPVCVVKLKEKYLNCINEEKHNINHIWKYRNIFQDYSKHSDWIVLGCKHSYME